MKSEVLKTGLIAEVVKTKQNAKITISRNSLFVKHD